MKYDEIVDKIGVFGKWHQKIIFSLWIARIFTGIHNMMYAFTALSPSNGYRCQIPSCEGTNFSFNDFDPELLFPSFDNTSEDYNPKNPNYCRFYNPITLGNGNSTCSHLNFSKEEIIEGQPGSIFDYEDFEMSSTVVTKWDLVCEDGFKGPLTGSPYMVGMMIGSFTLGTLSDRFGRKPLLMLSFLLTSGGGLLGAFVPEYYSFLVTRVLTGIGAMGLPIISQILMIEYTGTNKKVWFLPWISYKTFYIHTLDLPYAFGTVTISLIAGFVTDWQTLQWTISAVGFLSLLFWFIIPESPRWLIANNREKEALKILKDAAKQNGNKLPPNLMLTKVEDGVSKKPQYGFKDLFNKSLLKITLILWVCWPAVALSYFGLSFSMGSLNDDFFMSFILSALVEIPAVIFALLLVDIWGRKPLLSFSLIIIGTSCILCGFLEAGVTKTVLALIGKFFAATSFGTIYQYTAEVTPTLIRNTSLGMCSMFSRIGSIVAPFIATYLPLISTDSMPFLVIGVAAGIAGILALLLPDTLGPYSLTPWKI